jgi:hypothetical protein
MKSRLAELKRVSDKTWFYPLALLLIGLLAYAYQLVALGFYWDDWEVVFLLNASDAARPGLLPVDRPSPGLIHCCTLRAELTSHPSHRCWCAAGAFSPVAERNLAVMTVLCAGRRAAGRIRASSCSPFRRRSSVTAASFALIYLMALRSGACASWLFLSRLTAFAQISLLNTSV